MMSSRLHSLFLTQKKRMESFQHIRSLLIHGCGKNDIRSIFFFLNLNDQRQISLVLDTVSSRKLLQPRKHIRGKRVDMSFVSSSSEMVEQEEHGMTAQEFHAELAKYTKVRDCTVKRSHQCISSSTNRSTEEDSKRKQPKLDSDCAVSSIPPSSDSTTTHNQRNIHASFDAGLRTVLQQCYSDTDQIEQIISNFHETLSKNVSLLSLEGRLDNCICVHDYLHSHCCVRSHQVFVCSCVCFTYSPPPPLPCVLLQSLKY
jgi:hypothetical protein